jgi:hypothetical protein
MKRSVLLIVSALLLATVLIGLSMASGDHRKWGRKCPHEWNFWEKKRGDIHPMAAMMRGMMSPSIVATADGGVVVRSFNRLMKFDKDLNLVKQADIPFDAKAMAESMKQVSEHYSECTKTMKKGHMMKKKGGWKPGKHEE